MTICVGFICRAIKFTFFNFANLFSVLLKQILLIFEVLLCHNLKKVTLRLLYLLILHGTRLNFVSKLAVEPELNVEVAPNLQFLLIILLQLKHSKITQQVYSQVV